MIATSLRLTSFGLVLSIVLGGCNREGEAPPPAAVPAAPEPKAEPIALDSKASPVEFRRLDDAAILVSPGREASALAKLGNFIAAAARGLDRAHLTVWDDEAAWKRAAEGRAQGVEALSDRRAEYVKEKTPQPIETYTVFGPDGGVTYERDFRDWPLTDLDVAPLTD